MPDYKESNVTGRSWNRFCRVVIDNPRNASPSVLCVEQEITALGDKDIQRDIGNLGFVFDPAASFPALHPETHEPTGATLTGAEVYVAVLSYVMSEAKKRDEAA